MAECADEDSWGLCAYILGIFEHEEYSAGQNEKSLQAFRFSSTPVSLSAPSFLLGSMWSGDMAARVMLSIWTLELVAGRSARA